LRASTWRQLFKLRRPDCGVSKKDVERETQARIA